MSNSSLLRVGYDARMALGAHRGMGAVLRAAISSKVADFYGFCANGEQDETLRLQARGMRFYPLWEQVSLPRQLRKYDLDIFLAPYNTSPLCLPKGMRSVVVIHDIIYMEPLSILALSPSVKQNLGRIYRRWNVPRAAAQADHIVTVSEYSKQLIVSRFGVESDKISVIHCSLDDSWMVERPAALADRGNYILSVSGEAPSKNLPAALNAYAAARSLARPDTVFPQLWIAGISGRCRANVVEKARQLGIADHIHLLPFIPTTRLQELYRQALFVFAPSLQEGFGIPVLEAMASGTPVVSSDATSLPEVGGEAPLYVNPRDVESMAEGLARMAADAGLRELCIHRGMTQRELFRQATLRGFDSFWEMLSQKNR